MARLAGTRVVLTGASRGIGKATGESIVYAIARPPRSRIAEVHLREACSST